MITFAEIHWPKWLPDSNTCLCDHIDPAKVFFRVMPTKIANNPIRLLNSLSELKCERVELSCFPALIVRKSVIILPPLIELLCKLTGQFELQPIDDLLPINVANSTSTSQPNVCQCSQKRLPSECEPSQPE